MLKNLLKKMFKEKEETETIYVPTKLAEAVNNNSLDVCVGNLYSHFCQTEWLDDEPENPEWYNQAVYFWKKEEAFERKSLPPTWNEYNEKYFIINNIKENVNLVSGIVAPWFGMPGGGEKFCFKLEEGQNLTIKYAFENKIIMYVNPIEVTENNLECLSDRNNYLILVDRRILQVNKDKLMMNNKEITPIEGYLAGGLYIMEIVKQI